MVFCLGIGMFIGSIFSPVFAEEVSSSSEYTTYSIRKSDLPDYNYVNWKDVAWEFSVCLVKG